MTEKRKSTNYWITWGSGMIALLLGVYGVFKTAYWLYLTSTDQQTFTLASFLTLVGISLFVLCIGIVFLINAKRIRS